MKTPIKAVDARIPGIDSGLTVAEVSNPTFTKDGKYLTFWLKELEPLVGNVNGPLVDVWTHHDVTIQSMQLMKIAEKEVKTYQAVIAVEGLEIEAKRKIIRLMHENDEPAIISAEAIQGDHFLVRERKGGDRFWERKYIYKLLHLKDGHIKNLHESREELDFWYSPNFNYLIQFNAGFYYSYDLKTGIKRNISSNIPVNLSLENPNIKGYKLNMPVGLAGFVGRDEYVLVYDNYDIWKLHLTGEEMPLNLTREYGRLHNVKIRLVDEGKLFQIDDTLLLSVFDPIKKYNGLYQVSLSSAKAISEPVTGPYSIFYRRDVNHAASQFFNDLQVPLKARDTSLWIEKRESAVEAPNYFVTSDFRQYKQLTAVEPHKTYNWLTAEVWHWKKTDNSTGQCVLYKPANFDPQKKYPMIISCYESMTGSAHQFPKPKLLASTAINVPWFVSRGYLVMRPDIVYTKGKIVESVCNTVISAAKSFSSLPFVDGNKIGISGFSWGGHEINWLITNSDLFAAAATGGGMSDPISSALQIADIRGNLSDDALERREDIIGASIWESPSTWISASSVLKADKVKTPLLILYNYGDKSWQQGGQLYSALRRLNKKVWLLQYDRGAHGLDHHLDIQDFTIRLTQFFDHYLKDAPAPKWMTKGIPAKLKGVELGYDYDTQ
jgi:dienelactone hydrolase